MFLPLQEIRLKLENETIIGANQYIHAKKALIHYVSFPRSNLSASNLSPKIQLCQASFFARDIQRRDRLFECVAVLLFLNKLRCLLLCYQLNSDITVTAIYISKCMLLLSLPLTLRSHSQILTVQMWY